jgi:hypothetical protein
MASSVCCGRRRTETISLPVTPSQQNRVTNGADIEPVFARWVAVKRQFCFGSDPYVVGKLTGSFRAMIMGGTPGSGRVDALLSKIGYP